MDTAEKDQPIPKKSTCIVSTHNEDNHYNKNDSDPDPNSPNKKELNNPLVPANESKPENRDADESSEIIKEETSNEESSNAPESPHLPPDLIKISEEIDEFISTLSAAPKSDEKESSAPLPDVPICVKQFTVLVESKIDIYDSRDSPVKFIQLSDEDSASFLEAVNRVSSLSKALSEFSSEYKYAYSINSVGGVLQRALSYIEEEFKSLLEDHKLNPSDLKIQSASSTSSVPETEENPAPELEENNFPEYSDEILSNLIKLSKAMLSGGYEIECSHVYFVARRYALEESLQKIGFKKYSIDDVQKMSWESLEREIEIWIKTFKHFSTVQLSSEWKLLDAVFSDYPSLSKTLFGSLALGVVIQLLNIAGAVKLTKRAPEKLFKFLDTYEALRNIPPEIEKLFPDEWVNEIKTEASMISSRLGEAIISIVIELENAIKTDSGKTPVPGGAVHPLTKYIMNYLTYACEYKETLEKVFKEHQKIERADSATGSECDYNNYSQPPQDQNNNQSPFQAQVGKVMNLLDSYLEEKSKLYRDPSLSSIFMMNNGRYILQKIKGCSEINSLMGDPWFRKRSGELRNYHKGYQRETWGRLLHCLHPEGLLVNGKIHKPHVKERFNNFNKMFDEIHKTQSSWVVGDEQLQSELRVSISNMVIPAYRSFLGRFGQVFTPGRQTEKYVKFQPEDIETYIDELFDGNASQQMGRKKM